ncbi:UDP-4-amino-4-deoxy-L-arabinose--oxoglutarate aminotransferase [bacterium BMS3Abin06]|nr:UDP-4-amino-4-deoxy-L-arabinose--oxoglutarate aminotransferase [bacterium BMS3Abin06]
MLKIRIGDIHIGDEEKKAINEVLESGRISEHGKVREFESEWAKYTGRKYSVATNSGTAALLLGLQTLLNDNRFSKIKKGGRVITSPLTYTATSNAVVLSGLEPVYVDIDPATFTLQTDRIEDLLKKGGKKYCMVLPVHLMGYVNDMDAINMLAEKYDLVTFEDAAQAHGSKYKGKMAGSLSLLADFSFYIAHNIQAGEMGAVVTGDAKIQKLAKKLKANGRVCSCAVCTRSEGKCPYKNKGFDPRFTHEYIGYNFKTTEFQAALALSQLNKIDRIINRRRYNVKYLNEKLLGFSDIFQLPVYSEDVSYLAYPIIIKRPKKLPRKKIMRELEKKGVEVRPLFGCIPAHQPAYRYLKKKYDRKLPNADYAGRNGFYIGCHQYLTGDDLEYIVQVFNEVLKGI